MCWLFLICCKKLRVVDSITINSNQNGTVEWHLHCSTLEWQCGEPRTTLKLQLYICVYVSLPNLVLFSYFKTSSYFTYTTSPYTYTTCFYAGNLLDMNLNFVSWECKENTDTKLPRTTVSWIFLLPLNAFYQMYPY